MKKIGITTTVPIEVLFAAGYNVVDLNNMFLESEKYDEFIDIAERDGFPKSTCAWIKGIYGACISNNIEEILGVVEGDCSNTKALLEVLRLKGIKIYTFSYPVSHNIRDIKKNIDELMKLFGVTIEQVEEVRQRLNLVRKLTLELDSLTYKDNKTTGFENHLYQVSMSDFYSSDINKFEQILKDKIKSFSKRKPFCEKIRLGYIGVPPMTLDIYEFINSFNARCVYNEVQREFSFPRAIKAKNIYEQYWDYTYVYDIEFRLKDIKKQIVDRKLDGIIHYTQAFCYRAIEDIIIKEKLDIPVLNIEGDKSNKLDSRTRLRIEAFLDMLKDQKEANL